MTILASIFLLALIAESIFIIIYFLVNRPRRKKNKDRNKKMRVEFNSAMIHVRNLERLLDQTAREDGE